MHAAAIRHADHHRRAEGPVRAVAQAADLADDLVEGRVREVGELHLGDRSQAVDGGAHGCAGDHRLGERGVEDALVAVFGPQPIGRPEDATLLANVLAEDHHVRIALHLLVHAGADRLQDVHVGHGQPCPSA